MEPMTFPSYINKYSSKPVFSPDDSWKYRRDTGREITHAPLDGLIICYAAHLGNYIAENYTATIKQGHYGSALYFLEQNGKTICIIVNTGFGAPIAVALVERFISRGADTIINLGIAGTLQPYVNIGDIVVCDKAIRDEGTSYHYLPPARYSQASPELTAAIQQELKKKGTLYHTGASWTTDAPYRETVVEVKHFQSEGILTVDMEASALFAVGEFRRVQTGSIFTISDSLADLEWKPAFQSEETAAGLETILNVSIDVLSSPD
jgi:uridine phosphorylase